MPDSSSPSAGRTLLPLRNLRRSRDNKMIAGVAGGVAEFLNVDPLLVRVVLAALTPFGGAGLLLYAAGWLLVPAQGEPMSIGESALKHGRNGGSFAEAVLLIIAVIAIGSWTISDHHDGVWLLVATLVGAVLLYRHLDAKGVTRRSGPDADASPNLPGRPAEADRTASAPRPPMTTPDRSTDQSILSDPPTLLQRSMDAVNQEADRIAAEHLAAEQMPMRPTPGGPPQSRQRSALGPVVASVALIVFGVIAALAASSGEGLSVRHTVAIVLGIVGLGVLAGAWWGRARGLIALGVPLTVVLIAVSSMPLTWRGAVGRSTWRPAAVTEIQSQYQINGGRSQVDFSAVDFTGTTAQTDVRLGAGKVTITVPPNVDVVLHAKMTAGEIDAFGQNHNGGDLDYRRTDNGPDGVGGGTLNLNVQGGFGVVEVDRAAA
jgi:phage shock protein PspC (stress-responsive transcriptional regulator)